MIEPMLADPAPTIRIPDSVIEANMAEYLANLLAKRGPAIIENTTLTWGNYYLYVIDGNWWIEQKVDGIRLVITIDENGDISAHKRGGNAQQLPTAMAQDLRRLSNAGGPFVLDGEYLTWEMTLYLFDMPLAGTDVTIDTPYEIRRNLLGQLYEVWKPAANIRLLPVAKTPEEKRALVEAMIANQCEGVMLKDKRAPYVPGVKSRRSKQVTKGKFTRTADVIVHRLNIASKDNLSFVVLRDDVDVADVWDQAVQQNKVPELIEILLKNNVAVPVGKASTIGKPACNVGDVLEVKYLYCVDPQEPRLVQPTILKVRDDKKPAECFFAQLEYTTKAVIAV